MRFHDREEGWVTGRLYFNRKDKRVLIKRPHSGLGYTMNLGNIRTWMLSIVFVAIIVAIVALVSVF